MFRSSAGALSAAARLKPHALGGSSIVFSSPQDAAGTPPPDADRAQPPDAGALLDITPLNRPLFKVCQGSYWAVRIPLLRSGFKRVSKSSCLQSNVLWRRPFSISTTRAEIALGDDGGPQASSATSACIPEGRSQDEVAALYSLKPTRREQWTNHFPSSYTHLGSKDGMYEAIRALQRRAGEGGEEELSIVPHTWVLPDDHEALARYIAANPAEKLIAKPARGSCGREIHVVDGGDERLKRLLFFSTAPEPPPKEGARRLRKRKWVVQQYIDPPALIDGRKYDMRIYVAVSSVDPLVAYVYREGLVRFASEQYDADSRLAHLTNSSLSRRRDSVLRQPEGEGEVVAGGAENGECADSTASSSGSEPVFGAMSDPPRLPCPLKPWQARSRDAPLPPVLAASGTDQDSAAESSDTDDSSWPRFKWSLSELGQHIQETSGDWEEVWAGIKDVILKGLIAAERPITQHLRKYDENNVYSHQSFELFGFDVMLDDKMRPWLIEVNCIPSLESMSLMDWEVKSGCMTDLFNLLGVQTFDRDHADMVLRTQLDAVNEQLAEELKKEPEEQDAEAIAKLESQAKETTEQLLQRPAPDRLQWDWDAASFAQRVKGEVAHCGGYEPLFPTKDAVARHAGHFHGTPSEDRNKELWNRLDLM